MNIFESIARATNRIEPFHSQFLADALTESLELDRSLFDKVWSLFAPDDWQVPVEAYIETEVSIEGGRGDICLLTDEPSKRVIGIEVKTIDDSTEPNQLSRYYSGLKKRFTNADIQLAYLTPFNDQRAGERAQSLPTVKEFNRFKQSLPYARHVSWLDVTSIPWDGSSLWKQHGDYVRNRISSEAKRKEGSERNRTISHFFGEELAARFIESLKALKSNGHTRQFTIDLKQQRESPDETASRLVAACRVLIENDRIVSSQQANNFPVKLREKFLKSPYSAIHSAMFRMTNKFDHVWIAGANDYGVRITHKDYPSGVSLVRSAGTSRLIVYLKRWVESEHLTRACGTRSR